MPKMSKCLHGEKVIGIEDALIMRESVSKSKRHLLNFQCIKCRKPVRPHKEGGGASAHFEHLERNEDCPLSDPLR